MPTEGEEAVAAIASRLAGVPTALEGLPRDALRRGAQGQRRRARGSTPRSPSRCAAGPVRPARRATSSCGLVGACGRRPRRAATATAPGPASAATAAFGLFLADDLAPRGRERDGVGRDRYALRAATSSAPRSTSRRPTPGAGRSSAASRTTWRRPRERIVPGGRCRRRGAPHLDADPARVVAGSEAFREWMQDLADRTIADDGRRALRHPRRRSGASSACIAPDQRRRHLLHRPVRDFCRPGRMWWSVPDGIDELRHLARGDHGVPRGRPRPPPPGRPDGLPQGRLLNRWQRLMCWVSRPRRGLGALRRAADGRARLPRRPRRPARHARRPGLPRGAGRSSTSACTSSSRSRADNPLGFHPGETWTPELGLEFMRAALPHGRTSSCQFEVNRYLGWPGQAPSLQGRRADLAAGPRRGRRPATAPASTSRRSTAPRSTWARWGSTRCRPALARL